MKMKKNILKDLFQQETLKFLNFKNEYLAEIIRLVD